VISVKDKFHESICAEGMSKSIDVFSFEKSLISPAFNFDFPV